jgi:SAM-dependent methyltransferase
VKKRVLDVVERAGLLEPSYRGYERLRALGARTRRATAPDGLPLPPPSMRTAVAGTTDAAWFLEGGNVTAGVVRDALGRYRIAADDGARVLDFGCGCGRVTRHLRGFGSIAGTDYRRRLVRWCAANLPFGDFSRNALAPPLEARSDAFDAVFAVSVFTHLTETLQQAWLAALGRVLRPGGLLLLTTHGDRFAGELTPAELELYRADTLVVRRGAAAGTNLCAAFHPAEYVRTTLARGFELLDLAPGAAGRGTGYQDLVVLRKPSAAP